MLSRLMQGPHRPFFLLSMITGMAGMAIFLAAWSGAFVLSIPVGQFHLYVMADLFFPQLIFGFLMTIFPRFLGTDPIPLRQYAFAVILVALAQTILFAGAIFFAGAVLAGMIGLTIAYGVIFAILAAIQRHSRLFDKEDTRYLLIALGSAVVSLAMQAADLVFPAGGLWPLARGIMINMFLTLTFLTVTQRMIPFFSTAVSGYTVPSFRKGTKYFALLLAAKTVAEAFDLSAWLWIADIGLLVVFGRLIYRLRLPVMRAPAILAVLYVGIGWFMVYCAVESLQSLRLLLIPHAVDSTGAGIGHLLYLGYFATMAVGFGSRVMRGHGGETITADRATKAVFAGIQAVMILRLGAAAAAALASPLYEGLILGGASLWIAVMILWISRYYKMLF